MYSHRRYYPNTITGKEKQTKNPTAFIFKLNALSLLSKSLKIYMRFSVKEDAHINFKNFCSN